MLVDLRATELARDATVNALELARARREEQSVDLAIDQHIEKRLSQVQLAAPIQPEAKHKLKGILKWMAKQDHPFRACTKANAKRFGPGRTEAVCATLTDQIKGRKDWRKGGGHSAVKMEDPPVIDGDVLLALDAISEIDLSEILLEARALEEHGTKEAVALLDASAETELLRLGSDAGVDLAITATQRDALKSSDFVFPGERGYPIDTIKRARNALARGSQHESGVRLRTIVSKVRARYPEIEVDDALLAKVGLKKTSA